MTPASTSLTATETGRPDRAIVALAWPTGRPIYPYTADEIADGVDIYTRRLKALSAKACDTKAGDTDAR